MSSKTSKKDKPEITTTAVRRLVGDKHRPIAGNNPREWATDINAKLGGNDNTFETTHEIVKDLFAQGIIVYARPTWWSGCVQLRLAPGKGNGKKPKLYSNKRGKALRDLPPAKGEIPTRREAIDELHERRIAAAEEANLREWEEWIKASLQAGAVTVRAS